MRQKSNLKLRAFLLAFSIFLLSVGEILSPWNKEEAKNNEEEIRKHADLNSKHMMSVSCYSKFETELILSMKHDTAVHVHVSHSFHLPPVTRPDLT